MDIAKQCEEAKRLHQSSLDPVVLRSSWHEAVDQALETLQDLLRASKNLTDIETALRQSGKHVRALRHLLAPPLSQDQFQLACPDWSKSSEKNGTPLQTKQAQAVARQVTRWLDPRLTGSLTENDGLNLLGAAYLLARQEYETVRRNNLAKRQEADACTVIESLGFKRAESKIIDEPGAVAERTYLLTTRFATADGSSHEVDIAVGLPKRMILAIECKVSNDATNSIKRTNDIMKKSEAWKRQWGNFVITGAILQGVFKEAEIRRMLGSGIEVFWSHALEVLRDWLRAGLQAAEDSSE